MSHLYAMIIALTIVVFTFAAFQFVWKQDEVKPSSEFTRSRFRS